MIDTLTSFNWNDFNSRYNNTFGWFINGNARLFVQVTSTSSREVHFSNVTGDTYVAYADKGLLFEFIPITRGFYNTKEGVRYLHRVPAKQWRRGICPQNTVIYKEDKGHLIVVKASSFFNELSLIYEHPLLTEREALDSMEQTNMSWCALSKVFAISSLGEVYFFDRGIGAYADRKITLINTFLFQEMTDAVRRAKLPLEVCVA